MYLSIYLSSYILIYIYLSTYVIGRDTDDTDSSVDISTDSNGEEEHCVVTSADHEGIALQKL